MKRVRRVAAGRRGHLAIEAAIALTLTGIVLASAYEVLRTQRRYYADHVRRLERWEALNSAAEILAAELRGLSPRAGDLYALARDSVALRAFVGFGVVCAVESDGAGWLVAGAFGTFETRARDSLLVFVEGEVERADDDGWKAVHPSGVARADGARCADGRGAALRVRPAEPVPGVRAGAPIHAFRPYVYRLYRDGSGRWWLGQRLRGGTIQPALGPLRSPEAGGLALEAFDTAGAPAGRPEAAVLVRISLAAGPAATSVAESLSAAAFLRNARAGAGP